MTALIRCSTFRAVTYLLVHSGSSTAIMSAVVTRSTVTPASSGKAWSRRLPSHWSAVLLPFRQEPCAESAPSPRLRAGRDGMQATVADCRRLEERSSELHKALKSFRGSAGVIQAVDLFGIHSAADFDELMHEATGYLSRFFDSTSSPTPTA